MKIIYPFLLSIIVFLASFQGSLLYVDYQINKSFYESICENKDRIELECNGKCQIKKNKDTNSSTLEVMKLSFEFNMMINKRTILPETLVTKYIREKSNFFEFHGNTQKGFSSFFPPPPQV